MKNLKSITDIIFDLNKDIDSLLDSINDRRIYVEALEMARGHYIDALHFGRVAAYDRAIVAVNQEISIIENLIREREGEVHSIHFLNSVAA